MFRLLQPLSALAGQVGQLAVEHCDSGEEPIAFDLQPSAFDRMDAAPAAHGTEAATQRVIA